MKNEHPTVASLFSGILGFDRGFEQAGFTPIWACEKDEKCQAVIRRHLPGIPLYDDVTRLDPGTVQRPDVLLASPPCQDFSVAGKRQSLEGVRGYLSIICAEFINRLEPDFVVVENVPGWLSAKGNAFGWFLGLLVGADTALVPPNGLKWTSSGVVVGPRRGACWTTLDSQFWSVAQRRERVYVVASARKECPAQVLFDTTRLRWHPQTSREKREEITSAVGSRVAGGSGAGYETAPTLSARNKGGGGLGTDAECDGALVPVVAGTLKGNTGQSGTENGAETCDRLIPVLARSLNAERDGYNDGSDQTYIPEVAPAVTVKQAKGAGGPARDECQNLVVTGPLMSDGKRMPGTQPDDAGSLVVSPVAATVGTEHKGPGSRDDFESIVAEPVAFKIQQNDGGDHKRKDRPHGGMYVKETDVALTVGSTDMTAIVEPIPILESGARTGKSTTDLRAGISIGESGDHMFTLQSGKQHAVEFHTSGRGAQVNEDVTATLQASDARLSNQVSGVIVPVEPIPFDTTQVTSPGNYSNPKAGDPCHPLAAEANAPTVALEQEPVQVQWASGGGQVENPTMQALRSNAEHSYQFLRGGFGVRRLTAVECEKLQSLPVGWTEFGLDATGKQIPMSDSQRYKMLGNAVTSNVSHWIANRVKLFL